MTTLDELHLSRRERQIMDIIYTRERATASEVLADLPDPPTRTAVRTLLRILEDKGRLRHTKRGREFLYEPSRPRRHAAQSALRRVLSTFFEGSIEKAVAAYLADANSRPDNGELKRLADLVSEAKKDRS